MDYLKLLQRSFEHESKLSNDDSYSKYEYLSMYIFNFTTYDSELDELFVKKTIEVLNAIENRSIYKYIEEKENYIWYITLCNFKFFSEKISWGTSIRVAFWDLHSKTACIDLCGLFDENLNQFKENLKLNKDEWSKFIVAINKFIITEPIILNNKNDINE